MTRMWQSRIRRHIDSAGTARLSGAPEVNWLDMPEAVLEGGAGPLSRRIGYRDDRVKLRVKALALPVSAEDDVDPQGALAVGDRYVQSWSCVGCTFVNSGFLSCCEMCETRRERSLDFSEGFHGTPEHGRFTMQEKGPWPSLKESADADAAYEIASVASSWLEVDDVKVVEEADDDDLLLVDATGMPPLELSWASRARTIAGCGPAPALPASGVTIPPILRPKPSNRSKTYDEDVQQDDLDDLSLLENRRFHPHFDRGSRQRQRSKR
eukprot:TRINITY_DN41725_c0_g1_i1.p1 TRINITY_DN41725_c0_g1~~TRINITY_DN41725_c0_g1_i1.p1  ORF type:complete len:267 (-),score=48.94 TRINITY_DN41725_c0_g1_i1:147-947(-)